MWGNIKKKKEPEKFTVFDEYDEDKIELRDFFDEDLLYINDSDAIQLNDVYENRKTKTARIEYLITNVSFPSTDIEPDAPVDDIIIGKIMPSDAYINLNFITYCHVSIRKDEFRQISSETLIITKVFGDKKVDFYYTKTLTTVTITSVDLTIRMPRCVVCGELTKLKCEHCGNFFCSVECQKIKHVDL